MTIWSMCIACWIPKATNTHSECVILIAFPLQQWLYERSSMLRYTYIACLVNTVLNSSYTETWGCLNCMEHHNVFWHQKAETHSAEFRSPVSVPFLYLQSCYLWRFSYISKPSFIAQRKSSSWCSIFHFCLFSFKMLAVSFGHCWYSGSSSEFQKLLPAYCHVQKLSVCQTCFCR